MVSALEYFVYIAAGLFIGIWAVAAGIVYFFSKNK